MPDIVQETLRQLDRQFVALVEKGADLSQLPIEDWQTFAKGFAARNAVRTETRRMRWMVAEKILCAAFGLGWYLTYLMEQAYTLLPYERVQQNLVFLACVRKLEADSIIYLAAQQPVTVSAEKSATPRPARTLMQKYYDEWGDWYDGGIRRPSEWDIERVNSLAQTLAELVTYLSLFSAETETGTDPHGYAQVVADALPVAQAFQTYFPTFCALLNEANVLDLTEKVIVEEPAELAITLPVLTESAKSATLRPLARVESNRSAADFQGFAIFIVLEPRGEHERDLHGNYMSAEEVEKACLHWSIHHQRIDVGHDKTTEAGAHEHPDFRCVWNWMEYGEPVIGGYKVRPGTWMQAYQAVSEKGKAMFQNNEINCLSPGGDTTIWRDPKPESEAA